MERNVSVTINRIGKKWNETQFLEAPVKYNQLHKHATENFEGQYSEQLKWKLMVFERIG